MIFVFLFSVLLLSVATSLDVIWTDRGLRAGVAVEVNRLIVGAFHTNKPSIEQLRIFNLIEMILVVIPSFLGIVFGNTVATVGGLGVILANAARHYFKGYRAWRRLLS